MKTLNAVGRTRRRAQHGPYYVRLRASSPPSGTQDHSTFCISGPSSRVYAVHSRSTEAASQAPEDWTGSQTPEDWYTSITRADHAQLTARTTAEEPSSLHDFQAALSDPKVLEYYPFNSDLVECSENAPLNTLPKVMSSAEEILLLTEVWRSFQALDATFTAAQAVFDSACDIATTPEIASRSIGLNG
ncbi:hypothetical protein SCP_0901280 [Sparassis crispa]|uniref:Uncharacterized protein n=1 Tax=Sparassis crispa TaxID=139825 RepID=A0A401GVP5_9APHY|nr:hypothetical protein SCP_0901280 [Sparassis crispa]GBE86249.1 hypothetical protein SCP_0901280 [Sparassis crispa]